MGLVIRLNKMGLLWHLIQDYLVREHVRGHTLKIASKHKCRS